MNALCSDGYVTVYTFDACLGCNVIYVSLKSAVNKREDRNVCIVTTRDQRKRVYCNITVLMMMMTTTTTTTIVVQWWS